MSPLASVIVPAHNEESVVGLLLRSLLADAHGGELDVIVVANGCTDATASVAGSFGPAVRVVETDIPSKRTALRLGDAEATTYPRLYVDADVELSADDVRGLCRALAAPGVLAAAPERRLDLTGRGRLVRWYYDVWVRLPQVRDGLFGRGVLAVSEEGHERIARLPPVMADDLAASLVFTETERVVVGGTEVLIRTPRVWRDLLRRRIRAEVGSSQLELEDVLPGSTARTTPRDLLRMVRREPWLVSRMPVFLLVAVAARIGSRRALGAADFSSWLRDESSRRVGG
jgi:glycosyltransferase involved in cell wall biosynthesis